MGLEVAVVVLRSGEGFLELGHQPCIIHHLLQEADIESDVLPDKHGSALFAAAERVPCGKCDDLFGNFPDVRALRAEQVHRNARIFQGCLFVLHGYGFLPGLLVPRAQYFLFGQTRVLTAIRRDIRLVAFHDLPRVETYRLQGHLRAGAFAAVQSSGLEVQTDSRIYLLFRFRCHIVVIE